MYVCILCRIPFSPLPMHSFSHRTKKIIAASIGILVLAFAFSRKDLPRRLGDDDAIDGAVMMQEDGYYYGRGEANESITKDMALTQRVGTPSIAPSPFPPFPSGGNADIEDVLREDRMIVRSAYQSAVVEDVQDSVNELHALAERVNGFIVSSDISGLEHNPHATVSMRFPSESFDTVIMFLHGHAIRIVSESVNAEDVTEQYVDLEARLGNLRASEEQFLAIMERATDIEEVLQVQQQLERVRGEIESVTGRMQYLERTSSLSTLTAYLSVEEEELPVLNPTEKWSPLATVKAAVRELILLGQGALDLVIWAAIFSPIWGAALIGYLFWKRRR